MKLSTVKHFGDKAAVLVRWLASAFSGAEKLKQFPGTQFVDNVYVFDCTQQMMMSAEENLLDQNERVLSHYNSGDPRYLNPAFGQKIEPKTVAVTARKIACNDDINTPAVSRDQIASMNFTPLSSTAMGDGDLFYKTLNRRKRQVKRSCFCSTNSKLNVTYLLRRTPPLQRYRST
jgi:hypothetical protein